MWPLLKWIFGGNKSQNSTGLRPSQVSVLLCEQSKGTQCTRLMAQIVNPIDGVVLCTVNPENGTVQFNLNEMGSNNGMQY